MILFAAIVILFALTMATFSVVNGIKIEGLLLAVGLITAIVTLYVLRRRRLKARAAQMAASQPLYGSPFTETDKRRAHLGLGIMAYTTSCLYLFAPEPVSPTSRHAWLLKPVQQLLGPYGPAILFATIGAAFIFHSLGPKR